MRKVKPRVPGGFERNAVSISIFTCCCCCCCCCFCCCCCTSSLVLLSLPTPDDPTPNPASSLSSITVSASASNASPSAFAAPSLPRYSYVSTISFVFYYLLSPPYLPLQCSSNSVSPPPSQLAPHVHSSIVIHPVCSWCRIVLK